MMGNNTAIAETDYTPEAVSTFCCRVQLLVSQWFSLFRQVQRLNFGFSKERADRTFSFVVGCQFALFQQTINCCSRLTKHLGGLCKRQVLFAHKVMIHYETKRYNLKPRRVSLYRRLAQEDKTFPPHS